MCGCYGVQQHTYAAETLETGMSSVGLWVDWLW